MRRDGWQTVLNKSHAYQKQYKAAHFTWCPTKELAKCRKYIARDFVREEIKYGLEAGIRDENELFLRIERACEGFIKVDPKSEPLIKTMIAVMLKWWKLNA